LPFGAKATKPLHNVKQIPKSTAHDRIMNTVVRIPQGIKIPGYRLTVPLFLPEWAKDTFSETVNITTVRTDS
jgi:hypothetical protein